jgi:hypothetical protein
VPATILTLAMGSLSAYCFTLIARSCEMNGVSTYMEAWEKSVRYARADFFRIAIRSHVMLHALLTGRPTGLFITCQI